MDKRFKEQLIITAIVFITPIIGVIGYVYYVGFQWRNEIRTQQNKLQSKDIAALLAEADKLFESASQTNSQTAVMNGHDQLDSKLWDEVYSLNGKTNYPTFHSLQPRVARATSKGIELEMYGDWGLIITRPGATADLQTLSPKGAKTEVLHPRVLLYGSQRK